MIHRHHLTACMLTLLALAMLAGGCTTNPATGKQSFTLGMTEQQELQLGLEASPQFLQEYGGDIPSPEILAYVTDLGQRMGAVSERPELPWEFHVVDSEVINAFALPGGKVFFTRGLLSRLTNEAQMAGVLGHEIGHVTALHINQRIAQQTALQTTLEGIGMAGDQLNNAWLKALGVGGQVGGGVYLLKFGRDHESEADMLGIRYMSKLGYNPIGQVQVMEILQAASGSGGGAPEFLSTHPLPETRIKRLQQIIKEKYPDYNDPSKYKLREDEFRRNILVPLGKLPPAKHTGAASQ